MGVEGRGREMEMAGPVLVTVTQIHKLISVPTRDYHVFSDTGHQMKVRFLLSLSHSSAIYI